MKNLRLSMIALAVLGSVSAAFATKSHVKAKSGGTEYHITGKNGSSYIVVTASKDGRCNATGNACTATSTATPTMNGDNLEIPVTEVTVTDDGGTFVLQ